MSVASAIHELKNQLMVLGGPRADILEIIVTPRAYDAIYKENLVVSRYVKVFGEPSDFANVTCLGIKITCGQMVEKEETKGE